MFLFHNYTQQSMKIQLVLSLEVESDEFFWGVFRHAQCYAGRVEILIIFTLRTFLFNYTQEIETVDQLV